MEELCNLTPLPHATPEKQGSSKETRPEQGTRSTHGRTLEISLN